MQLANKNPIQNNCVATAEVDRGGIDSIVAGDGLRDATQNLTVGFRIVAF
jgi:hypothetical protein